jgi:tetratricopeptide (TPR) repeat protein
MIDSRWAQIEKLFFEAADLNEPERSHFLAHACASDPDLRREVESLLATDATAGIIIEGTIQTAAYALFPSGGPAADTMEGTRLGPWVILREIGRGGMGAVYLAARADAEFRKQVAIKLVKRGIDTDAVLQRFRHERQILAGLDHPNIAGLIDGGTSPDGRPYFVMEYVEGVPIQVFCDQGKLNIRERCRLFRKVCEPVSYAHRNLVIHRDLKPANILVTADGSPKLLDFGIARLLSQEATEHTVGVADSSARPFTPAYASPEQLRGEAVNTATDVYSLGAVLFHLLTGKRPILAGEIPRPSTSAQTLDGDVDNIVRKATHPEPGRRYQSVDELSEDLRRYLTGRPVLAREDSLLYSTGKFIRRHRAGVSAAVVFALVVTGGLASILWQARQTRIQRERAEERLDDLVEVANQTLLKVHGSIERLPGATTARREIVRTTLDYLDRLNKETGNDKRILSAMASAYIRLARIEGSPLQPNLGDYPGAEQTFRKAGRILDDLIAADPDNLALRLERVDCTEGLSQVLYATARISEELAETARGLTTTALILRRDPKNLAARKHAAALHLLHAEANSSLNVALAKTELEEQLPIAQQLAAEYPRDPDCILMLANSWSELGVAAAREGRLEESLASYQKSVALREQLFAINGNDVIVERDLMMSYGHIGDMLGNPFLFNLGDTQGALESYRQAAHIAESMVAADPSNRQAKIDLGIVLGRIGAVPQPPSKVQESLASLARSAEILEKLIATTPGDISSAVQLAVTYEYQGRRQLDLKDYHAALDRYRKSDAVCEPIVKIRPATSCTRQLAINMGLSADIYATLGDRSTAIGLATESLSRAKAVASARPVPTPTYLPRGLEWTGDVYKTLARDPHSPPAQRRADFEQAAAFYAQSLAAWDTVPTDMRRQYQKDEQALPALIAECRQAAAR